jgi:anti-sigma regulatory factor (Ser/Thr protein kinase)
LTYLSDFPWEQTATADLSERLSVWMFGAQERAANDDYSLLVCEVAPLVSGPQRFTLTPVSLEVFGQRLKVLALRQGCSLTVAEKMQLCWLEYANNLLKHSDYEGSKVEVELKTVDAGYCITITDRASAWHPAIFPRTLEQIPPEQVDGRGLALIRAVSLYFCLQRIADHNIAHIYFA